MMIEIIGNILKKIKVGAQYKSLIKEKTNKYVQDDCDLAMGAKKISYIAQSTFHTITTSQLFRYKQKRTREITLLSFSYITKGGDT